MSYVSDRLIFAARRWLRLRKVEMSIATIQSCRLEPRLLLGHLVL